MVGLRFLSPSRPISGPLGIFGSSVFLDLVVEGVWLEPVGNEDGVVFSIGVVSTENRIKKEQFKIPTRPK